jgi:hypothetical protein
VFDALRGGNQPHVAHVAIDLARQQTLALFDDRGDRFRGSARRRRPDRAQRAFERLDVPFGLQAVLGECLRELLVPRFAPPARERWQHPVLGAVTSACNRYKKSRHTR